MKYIVHPDGTIERVVDNKDAGDKKQAFDDHKRLK